MSGLKKAKKFDWKDSNMALFGSDVEKNVKKESAETEPAWKGAGQKPELQIWRIVKFKVKHWPKNDYGKLYNGDSYIILNTYKEPESEELNHDLHFWIGSDSTADEYGTAAYKTVELDTYLDDKPVQHREVMNHESDLFKSYFKTLQIMEGGAESGFKHVKQEGYKPRLLCFHGTKKHIQVKECELNRNIIHPNDVFILDMGLRIIVHQGMHCNKDEKFKASQYVQQLKSERGGKPEVEYIAQEELDEEDIDTLDFYKALPDCELEDDTDAGSDEEFETALIRVRDQGVGGKQRLEEMETVAMSSLMSDDVFILDNGKACFIWIGRDTSSMEKKNALSRAGNYLMKTKHPLVPISTVMQGHEHKVRGFNKAIGNC